MIVKNEENIIERLLASVLPIIDTYCICDTGSSDNTVNKITDFFGNLDKPIIGKICHHPFENFSHNRNIAIQSSFGMSSHILLLDADMKLSVNVNKSDFHSLLDNKHGQYFSILQGNNDYYYKNTRIIKNDGLCIYRGSTHEYLSTPTLPHLLKKDDIFINDIGDGGCKSDKFERDIQLLSKDLEKSPNDSRTLFYLANSYYCLNKYDEAIPLYQKRIDVEGWDQEVWYSYFRIGLCHYKCNRINDAIQTWLKGYDFMPTRIENLYEIVKHYRIQKNYTLAELFINVAHSQIENKSNEFLFLQNDIYSYKLIYEYSIVAFYLGITNIGPETIHILNNNINDNNINQTVLSNLSFYPDTILKPPKKLITFSTNLDLEINGEMFNFVSSSPCLILTKEKDGYWMNIRFVNYSILDDGSYTYSKSESNPNVVITVNKLARLSQSFDIQEFELIKEDTVLDKINGTEDIRIRLYEEDCNDKLEYIGTSYNTVTNCIGIKTGDMVNNAFENGCHIITQKTKQECEKNWVFLNSCATSTSNSKVIYKWFPLQIGEICSDTNTLKNLKEYDNMPNIFRHVRGSSGAFDYITPQGSMEKWFITHLVSFGKMRKYYHMFVVFNEDMKLLKYSAPFKFTHSPIEYCLSIIVNTDNIIIPYSTMDRTTDIAIYGKEYIDSILYKNEIEINI